MSNCIFRLLLISKAPRGPARLALHDLLLGSRSSGRLLLVSIGELIEAIRALRITVEKVGRDSSRLELFLISQ